MVIEEMTVERAKTIVREMLDNKEVSLNTLHKEAGYSVSAWSDYLQGKYTGTVKNLDAAIVKFVGNRQSIDNLYPTKAFNTIQKVCRMAYEFPDLAIIHGDAGCGKTKGGEYYVQHHNHAIYVRCNPALHARELLDEILIKLKESTGGYKSLNFKISKIQMALKVKRLIILDEPEHLPVRTLDMIRAIYDDGSCGLLLMGQDVLLDKLNRSTVKENLNYFRSRVGLKYEVKRPDIKEIAAIIHSKGITVSSDLLKQIDVWIKGEGELRKLDKIIKRARDIAGWSGQKIVDERLIQAGYSLTMGRSDDETERS